MKKTLIVLILSCVVLPCFCQSRMIDKNQVKILHTRIDSLERIIVVGTKQQERLNFELQLFKTAYDNQWSHFSRIVDLVGLFVGLIIPFIGLVAYLRLKSEVNKKITTFSESWSSFQSTSNLRLENGEEKINKIEKKALTVLAQNAMATSYVYLRMPDLNAFDPQNHLTRSLDFALQAIQINAELLFEENGEEGRHSIMNAIAYTTQIFDKMKTKKMDLELYLGWNRVKAKNYNFDFIHKLRKHFPSTDSMRNLNTFEENLRHFNFYGAENQ